MDTGTAFSSTPKVRDYSSYENGGLVDWALRRLEAVRNVGATLHPLAHRREETFDELWKRQMDNEFPTEIELIHTPPN